MGSTPKTQTVINKTELPPWIDHAAKENLEIADQLAQRPYVPYTGQITPGTTGLQEAAFNNALENADAYKPLLQGAAALALPSAGYVSGMQHAAGLTGLTPGFNSAIAYASNLAGLSPDFMSSLDAATTAARAGISYRPDVGSFLDSDIGAYMNPYIETVEDRAIQNQNRAFLQNLNQIGDAANKAGAFGGSRHGIAEGVAAAENARTIGDLSAQLRAQAFDAASQNINADLARRLQGEQLRQNATGLLANIAGMGQQARSNAASQIASFATTAQQLQQAGAEQLANILQNTRSADLAASGQLTDIATAGNQMAGQNTALLSALGAQQREIEQALLAEEYAKWKEAQDFPLQQLNLRLAAVGATPYGSTQTQTTTGGGGGSTGLSILGSVLGILPMLFGLSDKRDKTDIEKLGVDPKTGLPIYAYRYKGDPKNYPKIVGPMAQDVEKKFPGAVEEINGHKVINLGFGDYEWLP